MDTNEQLTAQADDANTVSGLSTLNAIAALWLIGSPFFLGYANTSIAMWDCVVIGIAVLILAVIRATDPVHAAGLSWLNAILGAWVMASPFVLLNADRPPVLTGNMVIVGMIMLAMGISSALTTPSRLPLVTRWRAR
jgi:hypothetical protein